MLPLLYVQGVSILNMETNEGYLLFTLPRYTRLVLAYIRAHDELRYNNNIIILLPTLSRVQNRQCV